MAKIRSKKNSSKKDVIIEKASRLFLEKGFGAASMRDLAEHVGVEAASLYNHIQSKSEILQAICFKVANDFLSHLDAVQSSPESVLKKLERIIRFHIRMMMDQYEFVYISDHEWRHLPEPYLSNFLNQRRNYRRSLSELVARGIEKGEMKPIEPYVAVLTMLSAISGIESWHRSRKTVSPESLENNMVKYLIDGLKK
ncbi:MAG: TetR/AcrR family transcriptional regulator [Bacteroidota bacterium]|nr:TetR/AcrR family transcriptional regulator [Bacteroidota bacterium]MDP4211818.1 TetR/AcrR family transcriptional regulator [Bacteroidota bacterium]MDP4251082.1 TetR/AcrR family transcriptional regulator [Bacteroidota bacterium]